MRARKKEMERFEHLVYIFSASVNCQSRELSYGESLAVKRIQQTEERYSSPFEKIDSPSFNRKREDSRGLFAAIIST